MKKMIQQKEKDLVEKEILIEKDEFKRKREIQQKTTAKDLVEGLKEIEGLSIQKRIRFINIFLKIFLQNTQKIQVCKHLLTKFLNNSFLFYLFANILMCRPRDLFLPRSQESYYKAMKGFGRKRKVLKKYNDLLENKVARGGVGRKRRV